MPNLTTFLCQFVLFVLIHSYHRIKCANFSYEGENGPEHWGEHYPDCSGNKQSPINIETKKVEEKEFPALEYSGFENNIESVVAESNSHTVIVHIKDGYNKPTIKGGPLQAEYEFIQFHFHWGPINTVGSEHQVDGNSYSLEMHLVMALKKSERSQNVVNFAVLGFFGDVYNKSKGDLQDIFQTLGAEKQLKILFLIFETAIKKSGIIQLDNLENIGSLDNLTNIKRDRYVTYNGSLTTPPCTESVTWIIFEDILQVDTAMLNLLRTLSDGATGKLTRTYRPIQPLNSRKIYRGCSTAELGKLAYVAIAFFTTTYFSFYLSKI